MTPAEQKEQREQEPACGICCGIALTVMAIIAEKQDSNRALDNIRDGMKVVKKVLGKV
jgi:hypothetical protein